MLLKIKELRKQKKLSQIDLAEKIEVSVRMFAEYENETTDIPLKKLKKIADILEVNLNDLFYKENINEIVNEPRGIYRIENKDLLESKNETIAALKNNIDGLIKDKQKLENDKDFLKNVILGKMGNSNAS